MAMTCKESNIEAEYENLVLTASASRQGEEEPKSLPCSHIQIIEVA